MIRCLPALCLLSLLLGCAPDVPGQSKAVDPGDGGDGGDGADWVPPGCGDGVVADDEQCDDGADNSDLVPDACRSSCLLPACGDAVTDGGEDCDDGNRFGGDGCLPTCAAEGPQLEIEPNDSAEDATPWEGGLARGGLPADDRDCWALSMPACASLSAALLPDAGAETCASPAVLSLLDPDGIEVATGGPDAAGCATLDPTRSEGARFLAESDAWTLCLSGVVGAEVPYYALQPSILGDDDVTWTLPADQDPDGDGLPLSCDEDDDGDGVNDEEDNCPLVANGPGVTLLAPSAAGFLRTWLAAAPFTGTTSANRCLPSDDPLLDGVDDAAVLPLLGAPAGDLSWHVLNSSGDRVDLLAPYGSVGAPREVYVALYLRSPVARSATLALGIDDGGRAWLDGVEILEVADCQGTNVDQFTAPAPLTGDWQRLLIKVRDQGGGWGLYGRFLDEDGDPILDLDLSFAPDGAFVSDQVDTDGDGLGDVCDPTPAG